MKSRIVGLVVAAGFAALLFGTTKAEAMPAFARLYNTECSTCHVIFPERTPFGDAFRKNSYVWPGKLPEDVQKARLAFKNKAFGNMSGAQQPEKLKQWLVTIPDQVPIGFWVNHDIVVNGKKKPTVDLDGLTELEAFTAGSFRDIAGWWADYNFVPDHDIGEAYIQFRQVVGPVNVKVGRFVPKLSLWRENDQATPSTFGFQEMVVGVNPHTVPPTTGNPFMIDRPQGGVELNGIIGNRLFLAAGVLTPPEKDHNGVDGYGHVSLRIGGVDFKGNAPDISLVEESIWDKLTLTLGGFIYEGSSRNFEFDPATNRNLEFPNDFWRAGGEMEVLYGGFKLRANGIFGHDDNPQGPLGTALSERSTFTMVSAQYLFPIHVMVAGRFEYQDIQHEGITTRYVPSVVWAPWQNIKVALEYVHEVLPHNVGPNYINREYTTRFTYAY